MNQGRKPFPAFAALTVATLPTKSEEVTPMGNTTRIYNRWQGYTLADCSCIFCVNYAGRDKPCPLEVCCCEEERREAYLREYQAAAD